MAVHAGPEILMMAMAARPGAVERAYMVGSAGTDNALLVYRLQGTILYPYRR